MSSPRPFPFMNATPVRPPLEFQQLHANEPVSQITYPSGEGGYLVVRYEDVKRVLKDHRTFSRAQTAAPDAVRVGTSPVQPATLLSYDPPEHDRLRSVVAPFFGRGTIARMEDDLRTSARRLLDVAFSRTKEAELVSDFARPYSTLAILALLGLSEEFYDEICYWSDRAMALPTPDADTEGAAFQHLRAVFSTVFSATNSYTDAGILSSLADAHRKDMLSADELLQMAVTIVVAGHETTASVFSKLLYRLLSEPQLLDPAARTAPTAADMDALIAEMMRTSSSGGGSFIRVTTRAVNLAGTHIPAGSAVSAPPTGANLDPGVYPEPLRVDPTRRSPSSLVFGAGAHRCLGEHLARLELRVAVQEFLHAQPEGTRLASRGVKASEWIGNRPLQDLPVTWS